MVSRLYLRAKYSFDTSAFIDSWRRWYPPLNFVSLWNYIADQIENEKIIASIIVRKELERQHDDLLDYVNKFSTLFKNPTQEEQDIINQIINDQNYEHWGRGELYEADPFVIALASVHNLTVVTYEHPNKNGKIPAACRDYNVDCCDFPEYIRRENLLF
ncbi:MAG: DUF4411 family protein [Promethearchaeota archaeon]|nr:MAG: DUF4411 family protein [Candidatus Lokiarchaeota archaeon]